MHLPPAAVEWPIDPSERHCPLARTVDGMFEPAELTAERAMLVPPYVETQGYDDSMIENSLAAGRRERCVAVSSSCDPSMSAPQA